MVFVKYIDIERLGTPENDSIFSYPDDELVVEEKVDGGNGSFFIEDGVIHVGSRNRDLTAEKDESAFAIQRAALMKMLEPNIDKINSNYIYYVEWMQKHTIFYGKEMLPVIGLDIKPIDGAFGKIPSFIGRKAKETEFAKLGIPCVALKGIFKPAELTDEAVAELCKTSAYYDGKPEGIVIKNYRRMNVWGRQIFSKMVLDEFKETNRAIFGGLKQDTSDTLKLLDHCMTTARIRKRILTLTTEGGQPLERKLMAQLPTAVMSDVFKEETAWIMRNCDEIKMNTLKSITAKRCLAEIDAMMMEKARGATDG